LILSRVRIVFVNQYYPPDVAPTGLMLESVAEQIAAQGHEVTVLCASGGYSGGTPPDRSSPTHDAASAIRTLRIGATKFGRGTFVGKLADYASFYFGVAWTLARLQPRPARVVSLTTPPFLSILARMVSKAIGADHAHWVMDLYPDVMVAHGMIPDGGWLHRRMAGLTRFGFGGKRSVAVVTLGPDMAEKVAPYLSPGGPAVDWVPLWGVENRRPALPENLERPGNPDEDTAAQALRRSRGWADSELVVMYSGNMGLGHRFGEILDAAKLLGEPQRFAFFGEGKRRPEIARFLRENPQCRLELHGYAPAEQLAAHLRSGDVHLVTLQPEWTGTMLPSKLQGIFAAGRPAIFIGDPKSSSAGWVRESGGGWAVDAGDLDGLLAAIAEARDPELRARRGHLAKQFHDRCFDEATNSSRLARMFTRTQSL
jgi:hypothetical protein